MLEALGPFRTKQTHIVTGDKVNAQTTKQVHSRVESSTTGGFFPLGANNLWHGGVHLPTAAGSDLVAPFDGEIVAVRLDSDPATAMREYGSTNFVLLRHEITPSVHALMQGKSNGPVSPTTPTGRTTKPGVGGRFDNAPVLVLDAKQRLRALGNYAVPAPPAPDLVDEPEVEHALIDAINSFQALLERPKRARTWPDGSMGFQGYTWRALFADDDDDDDDDDLHDLDDDDLDDPVTPPSEPASPERIVYSLLMHVGAVPINDALAKTIRWLQDARVTGVAKQDEPPQVKAARERDARHEEDVAEASERRIKTDVGDGLGDPEDVIWVRKRLIRFGFLTGEPTAVADAELAGAVTAFQEIHVFARRPKRADGVVSHRSRGGTASKLRRTRRRLGLDPHVAGANSIDPLFMALVSEHGVDGMSRVVSGLNVRVRAGDVMWRSGAAASFSEQGSRQLRDQVHWEIFSGEKLFADGHDGWDSIVDPDEDLTVDAPRALVDLVADGTFGGDPPFGGTPDGLVDLAELMVFYRGSNANVLRRRQCKFRTEWGLDIDTTVARLAERSVWFDVDRLRKDLVPYQWWADAEDRLPKDASSALQTHVWHYNPTEFVAAYQAILTELQPAPPADREHFSDVQVRVLNRHGTPLGAAHVELQGNGGASRTETTHAPNRRGIGGGVLDFFDVPKGPCRIIVDYADKTQAWTSGPLDFEVVAPQDINVFTVETDVDGPLPATGSLRIHVRKNRAQFRDPVAIEVTNAAGEVAFSAESKHGTLVAPDLRFGEYTVHAADRESDPLEVEIKAKREHSVRLHLLLSKAPLSVLVTFEERPAEGVAVVATDSRSGHAADNGTGTTGVDGICVLDLREGHYKVQAGKAKERTHAFPGRTKLVELELEEAPSEPDAAGLVNVEVRFETRTSSETPTGHVYLTSPEVPTENRLTAPLDGQGRASFRVPPGSYIVHYQAEEAEVSVDAGATASVVLTPYL